MRTLIVEDSRLARKELVELISNHKDLIIAGEAENFDEALKFLNGGEIDLLFLDINLPGKNGFELLEQADDIPMVIFTTAYDEYAIKSFEYNALDYLLKPVKPEALDRAISKARKLHNLNHESTGKNPERIFIKDGDKCWLINVREILCFKSEGNYSRIYFQGNKVLLYKSLNQIEEKLDLSVFFRASRTHIINLNYIKAVKPGISNTLKLIMENDLIIETSRRNAQKLKSHLSF